MSGRDSTVIARTGFGKTLCIVIPRVHKIVVTNTTNVKLQVKIFTEKYNIRTVAINEDTPDSPDLWEDISLGKIPHLIVQPEQFRLNHGHLPKMARLLHDHKFVTKVKRVAVDEAHNIYTAGTKLNGRPPFRPAWGALDEVRSKLPKSTTWQALSATIPSHIYRCIHDHLGLYDPINIRVSINRPNIIYANHVLIDGRRNLRNLDCIVPQPFHPPMRLPKLIIFHGEKLETSSASQYLDSRLPPPLRKLGICRHYHIDMSPEYLKGVYDDFANPDGTVSILCATAGAGEGLDVPGINGVINYGIPEEIPMRFQRDGRARRSSKEDAFAITMLEFWMMEMDLTKAIVHFDDPDRPLLPGGFTKWQPTKQERTGTASLLFARSSGCKRDGLATYFEDDSDEGSFDFDLSLVL
ncbi:P-loop containing nucleoside triphosphate hydrolase protein [Mycena rebaudengoi]|nr:P-loop containing nucleoside triphosphate hydrolase protein [Mycena rebaudengoi]